MKKRLALLALAFIASGSAFAERSQTFGDIEVHYNAISTDDLTPDVAKSYKLDRSKNRGLLTIAVLKKNKLGVGQPIKAEITASATNMSAQLSSLTLREVQEGNAIYYLGDFRVSPPDTMTFAIKVIPQGESKAHDVDFKQQYFR
ncbi:DUF4426 domain-containing protein [Sulfurirhabdus autotrophica]|uniref:Uncharacterized protein DUF4426 n=1 Tax=Sulfurirhabdus autotrophica TaxID=1706046 RepID=A0A4R3Y8F4_9PROT|nr:DUF4426 domain-containing protein [Sulfurirhabdus autotrophica]TCV88187.1 uncharacterized protein DUF4426 [Sulfurirhabdus autotrophica]